MKRVLRIVLRVSLVVILMLPVVLILLVRFTDGTISGGDSIILGYDEDKARFQFFEKKAYELNGIDGPYIIGNTIIRVTEQNEIRKEQLQNDSLTVFVNNDNRDSFIVPLGSNFESASDEYALPNKLIAISDIEGNFDTFSGFLQSNNVIDDKFNWIFADSHVVFLGDFVDRGKSVIPTLWLIYKLENEAEKYGGKVHFVLGNHEIMNIQGNFYYAEDKYKRIASEIGGFEESRNNNKVLFSKESHLGKWLRSKNVVEKIGDYLFVHAGLSPEILSLDLEINEINHIVRENIDARLYKKPNEDEKASFLMGVKSPFWYRGFVIDYKYYHKISDTQLDDVLSQYNSKRFVIGHTLVDNVSKDFEGKVIRIDVKHGHEKFSEETKGLMIKNGKEFSINGLGEQTEL